MKRKGVLLLVLALMVTSLAACGKKETKKEVKTEKTNSMSGVLESFQGGTVKMKADEKDNPELTFEVKEAKIECKNMLAGDEIVVVYDGKITGTDTSKAKVKKVIDDGKNTAKAEVKESTIVGTVVNATMNALQIQTNDGTKYTFSTLGAEQVYKNGILEGNWVTVTYVGDLKGTDTTGVKVIKIRDDDANVIAKEQKKMNIKAVDETVYATAGVYIRESYSTDSKILGSLAQGTSIQRTGVCDNGWSRVSYNGADAYVYGDYLTTTAPVAPQAPAKTNGDQPGTPQKGDSGSSQPTGSDGPTSQDPPATDDPTNQDPPTNDNPPVVEQNMITGIVEDAAMGSLTIVDQKLNFVIGDAQHNYKNGIQRGNEVNVTYTGTINGTDTSAVTVVSVDDKNGNSTPTVTGSVANATMNTVTITTEDGINISFSLENAKVNCAQGILVGNKVMVTIDMNAAVGTSNIFPATQFDDVQ
ncbi:MAG: SH3 domain-containing protein [Lachnospiraceae bacterium]